MKIKSCNKKADGTTALSSLSDIGAQDVLPVKDFLKAEQKNGKDLCAEDVFNDTYKWLSERGTSW